MHFRLKHLTAATLFAASLSAISSSAFANITPDQSTAILKHFNETSVTDFRGFLGTLAQGLQRLERAALLIFRGCLLNDCCLANSCVGNSGLR